LLNSKTPPPYYIRNPNSPTLKLYSLSTIAVI